MAYPTVHHEQSGEAEGHNLEAIIPGQSNDTVVIVVHYDSMGPSGSETSNPGVDDDMTGMATQLDTARVLAAFKGRLRHTIRFVATDYEEWGKLEGARVYAKYLQQFAAAGGFKIVAAIDDEQSGWNCAATGQCTDGSRELRLLINDCSSDGGFASKELSGQMSELSRAYQGLPVVTECAGQDSDHYAFWEIGVPAIEFGEFSWQNNDHFDDRGGDTYERIDENYFYAISRVGVTFAAKTIGIL
jgi:Zn-dependent M28 family amino/carboxypeptidase